MNKTVTVSDKVLLVRLPNDIVLMRTRGESRTFTAPTAGDVIVEETASASFAPSSSWVGRMPEGLTTESR